MVLNGYLSSGLRPGYLRREWASLSPECKRKLTRLMARASEASYRRGLQQGVYLAEKLGLRNEKDNLYEYRYQLSLDLAPEANFLPKIKKGCLGYSWERSKAEYWNDLRTLGVDLP